MAGIRLVRNDYSAVQNGIPNDGSVTNAKVADDAGITQSKIANLVTDLASKAGTSDARFTDKRVPVDASVGDAQVSSLSQSKITGLVSALSTLTTDVAAKVATTLVGAANGLATLGSDGVLTAAQRPLDIATIDVTGTTYAFTNAANGALVRGVSSDAQTITLPANAGVGKNFAFVQTGTGVATFSAASGATIKCFAGHTKTGGQDAIVSLVVDSNAGGSAAVWRLGGDTGP